MGAAFPTYYCRRIYIYVAFTFFIHLTGLAEKGAQIFSRGACNKGSQHNYIATSLHVRLLKRKFRKKLHEDSGIFVPHREKRWTFYFLQIGQSQNEWGRLLQTFARLIAGGRSYELSYIISRGEYALDHCQSSSRRMKFHLHVTLQSNIREHYNCDSLSLSLAINSKSPYNLATARDGLKGRKNIRRITPYKF